MDPSKRQLRKDVFDAGVLGQIHAKGPRGLLDDVKTMIDNPNLLAPSDIALRADIPLTEEGVDEVRAALRDKYLDGTLDGDIEAIMRK